MLRTLSALTKNNLGTIYTFIEENRVANTFYKVSQQYYDLNHWLSFVEKLGFWVVYSDVFPDRGGKRLIAILKWNIGN